MISYTQAKLVRYHLSPFGITYIPNLRGFVIISRLELRTRGHSAVLQCLSCSLAGMVTVNTLLLILRAFET